jgi:prevent-host-death family protein
MNNQLPKIIPVNELKNTANIMKTCLESEVPIVITRNGYGEAVMMSIKLYEELLNKISEATKINESLKEIEDGASSIDGEEFFKNIKRKMNG